MTPRGRSLRPPLLLLVPTTLVAACMPATPAEKGAVPSMLRLVRAGR